MIFAITGCGQEPSMPIDTVESYLEKEKLTPISLRYSMNFSNKEMPWICLCTKEEKQYITVINNEKDIKQIQIGTEQYLSWEEMQDQLVKLGYENNEFLKNNLTVDISRNGQLYWAYPVEGSGELLFFSLEGEKLKDIQ